GMAANGNVSGLAAPGGPVTGSPPMYVICHVIVNVTHHVIVDPEGGPPQSAAGCQSTGGGSEPCLMMLAYTLSSASLNGPARPSGSPSKNRRRTSPTCPAAASSRARHPRAVRVTSVTRL